jgi:hypothetical protein
VQNWILRSNIYLYLLFNTHPLDGFEAIRYLLISIVISRGNSKPEQVDCPKNVRLRKVSATGTPYGISEVTGDHIVSMIQRIERSDELELVKAGPLWDGTGHRAAVVQFSSRRRQWRLIVSGPPDLMLRLKFQWVMADMGNSTHIQPFYSLDLEPIHFDNAWQVVERSEAQDAS